MVEEDAPVNPLEILYCWQSLLVASAAVGLTQLVKTAYDVYRGRKAPIDTDTIGDARRVGKSVRKAEGSVLVNRVILPGCPILFGVLSALVIPARPDPIMAYVTAHHLSVFSAMSIYAGWGAACGQFADYIFTRAKKTLGRDTDGT